jgi:hypothetical protein
MIEEEARQSLKQTESKVSESEKRLVFDYGGWLNLRYIDYNEDDNDSSSPDIIDYTTLVDSRIWLKATLKPALNANYENQHSLYIRFKNLYADYRPKDTGGGSDNDGPHLDYAYLILDLRPSWLKIGRGYFSIGQGITYSNVNDGAELNFYQDNWSLKTFVSHTLPHEDNIDLSVPGYDNTTDRFFYGLEYSYLGVPEQNFYGYVLIQRDYSDENPEDTTHDYTYNCEYVGLGGQGKIKSAISYWTEIIRQTGKSFIYNTNEKKDVRAWAGIFGIAYDFNAYSHPNFAFEYAFGSGDPDRTSVTDTQNGNASGGDKNFLYFGYIPAGYALAPRLSNLHIYRLGLTIKPLEKIALFKNLKLGVDYYRYCKDKASGGIYDTEASENSKDVGNEIDLTANWQIFSDLLCSIQYGYFNPGKAYPDSTHDSEEYLSLSMTLTF